MTTQLELRNFSSMNQAMKHVIETSRRVNTLALNAMFMVRSKKDQNNGFATIARLFRTFSVRLNEQMVVNAQVSNRMLSNAAKFKIHAHYDSLIAQALNDSRTSYIKPDYEIGVKSSRLLEMIKHDQQQFKSGLQRSINLVGEAETMTVLTRVEMQHADIDKKFAENLSQELESTVSNINTYIKDCSQSISL